MVRTFVPWLLLGWLMLGSAVGGARFLTREIAQAPAAPGEDGISDELRRYEGIRRGLLGHERVGFLCDATEDRVNRGYAFVDRQLVGYALCPILVCDGDHEDVVVARLVDPSRVHELAAARGLRVVRDYGQGVFLLERER